MAPGILLIHGYTGSPSDFGLLAKQITDHLPGAEVIALPLPGHDEPGPDFALEVFLTAICAAAAKLQEGGRELILVGHSTGGILALTASLQRGLTPRLLVLAAVPNRIDGSYLTRWSAHRESRPDQPAQASATISFTAIAEMVTHINAIGAQSFTGCPVLLLHGQADDLVPPPEMQLWRARIAPGPVRSVRVPGAGHHLFTGLGSAFARDVVCRAVVDAAATLSEVERIHLAKLAEEEPDLKAFLSASPFSASHVVRSASGRPGPSILPTSAQDPPGEPIFANIEITTRCNLRCVFCARTTGSRPNEDMSIETFDRVLELLPHAYRITLVGLGEPLLHPQVVACVAMAAARGRRVSLVTNALLLTPDLSRQLLAAGLAGITFSLDAPTSELAAQVRSGTDLNKALENIKGFNALAKASPSVARAVFSAVSTVTLPYLEDLIRVVAGLDVDVLMLSDLNFQENLTSTLWRNPSPEVDAAVRRAIRTAFALHLPVLSVRGLEALALPHRYQEHLLVPPAQLYTRSSLHTHCWSPWQTVPVAVDGTITLCDCQPNQVAGNLLDEPFSALWGGGALSEQRQRMLSPAPPDACTICPRF